MKYLDHAVAAITVYCEASSASPQERRCVVWTMFNRVKHGGFGESVAEVCLKRMQFSEWNADKANNANLLRATRVAEDDELMEDCLAAYDEVSSASDDPSGGATHYHDKTIAPPYWAVGATKTLETPKFIFYKDVK